MARVEARAGNRWRRYYDLEGPKIRLGVLWFMAQVVGIAAGGPGAALVMAVTCAAAAAHTLRTWRVQGRDADPTTALVGTAVVVAAALFGPRVMGVAVLLLVAGGITVVVQAAGGEVTPQQVLAKVGLWLQCSLPPALAGGCVVLLVEREPFAALALVCIVAAFDCGDFLIGSGSSNVVEGPVAGAAAVVVTTLAISSFGLLPFERTGAFIFGSLVAVLAPAGQYLATAMLPHSRSFAPALRRIDSLLLAAPLWYFGLHYILL